MGLCHNPSIITDGLVLALDSANVRSYSGSGTAWADQISNANNGTLQGSPGFSSLNGGVITFNGTNQYADCGYNSSIYNLTQNLTVEAWVRWTGAVATSGNGQWIVTNIDIGGTTNGGFQLGYIPGTGFYFGTYGNLIDVTYSGYFIYLNGVSVATNVNLTAGGAASRNLRIAHRERDGASAGYFPGYIPSVKIYNVALTASQVQQNFNALRGRFGI
jgi:hypothetical protein